MSLSVRAYAETDADAWDAFCIDSLQGTLLHTRRFLSYHGNRFSDHSLLIENEGKCIGVFPAALAPNNSSCIVSHPGISYGGIIHQGKLRGEAMVQSIFKICQHYHSIGLNKLTYKAMPFFYHQSPAQDDLYGLFRLGAVRCRCDLTCTIDLHQRMPVSERRRRGLKKSNKAGISLASGIQCLPALWEVLAENLARKHGVEPVHSLSEMTLLMERFPDSIKCLCGVLQGHVIAGVVIFRTPTADHAQYIASSPIGNEISALDFIFEHCIEQAKAEGRRWFDFGISNEQQGRILNQGLYNFKSEFGGGGAVHEFYEIDLSVEINYVHS